MWQLKLSKRLLWRLPPSKALHNLLQGKLLHNKPETTLNLWVAFEMTKRNGRQIDQGGSEYWLYCGETCTATDRQEKQPLHLNKMTKPAHSDGKGNSKYRKKWRERLVLPKVSLPSYITALPCSCCGPKILRPCSGIRHTLGQTNHPTGPWLYDFSQHFPKELSWKLKSICISKECMQTLKHDVLGL